MAGLVGFFTTIASAECYSLIMEVFDTSDLQPGMTGRPMTWYRRGQQREQRTNFTCYPRICAGFAITQALSYMLAAAATVTCGRVLRRQGQVWTSSGVAIILSALTVLLTLVVVRWKQVQILADTTADAKSQMQRANTLWRPVVFGNPSGNSRRLSVLEFGNMTRWSELRRRNRLQGSLSGRFRDPSIRHY